MEPLFFKAENISYSGVGRESSSASMEPLFFKAENIAINDAEAVIQYASMEPLFFKAENTPARQALVWRALPLQWSRFFSKRKMSKSKPQPLG